MLKLDYYLIDVGENSCTITKKKFLLDLKNALREKDIPRLEFIKEIALHNFKSKNPLFSQQDFKIVFINKIGKRKIKSELADLDTNRYTGPIISCKKYDIFLVEPSQRLDIECQVVKNEVEIRALRYENIVHKAY